MAEIAFLVLGPLGVVVEDVPVDLSSRKQRALLALLALHAGQVLSVDRLVDDLWGERPPPTARHALQVHVSNLRKLLGAATVVTQRPGYVLRVPPESCDSNRFEMLAGAGRRALRSGNAKEASSTLAEALALWRGPALADLLFEPFAAQEAARLEELKVAATEDRLRADLALGRHADLVGELEALVARHPLREPLWGLLMLSSYRSGRQVEALRAYKALRDHLREELGLDPGPELQRLEAAILRQDPALAAPAPAEERDGARSRQAPAKAMAAPGSESRRVATVLVAGLVGFDRVARALDPEDLRTLLDRCMARLGTVVSRYGGTVDNIVGGELMAVFGAPLAHEDDPERAVRAALDLHRAVTDHPDEFAGLELRVGVNTGEVLFAASGPPDRRQFTVMGEVVNEARRLEADAEAHAVLVGRGTHAATRSVVQYRDLGAGTYSALDAGSVKKARPLGMAPFMGREAELELLLRVWRRSITERRPHLVSILGEPGVGKSRQLAEFQRLVSEEGRVVGGRCLPYGEALSYAPLAEAFRQAAGASAEDPAATARSKLGELVESVRAPGQEDADMARHLALLTGLDDAEDRALGLVDERTLHGSTRRFLEALARDRPLCLVLEDVHWADDALLDLVQGMARRARDAPILIVTVARHELVERRSDWGGGLTAFTSIALEPLDETSTKALVAALGKAHGLPDSVLTDIASKCGGNPLFAEELVATVAEGDASTGVPASLTSLLLARLDALPAEQQLALKQASVIGMTFWPGSIQALGAAVAPADDEDASLLDTLADLEHRDLLRVETGWSLSGEDAYSFKHALIRDAAYGSLPRQHRKELHGAAVEWLSRAAGDRVGEFSDQLAHHAVASDQPERALEYLVAAADRSRRAASHRREASLLKDALDIAQSLGRPSLAAELRGQRGKALSRLALWPEARAELEECLAALPAESDDQLRRRAEVHCDLSTVCFWLLDTAAVGDHGRAALQLAEQIGAHDVQLAARAQITSADSASGQVDKVLSEGRALIEDAPRWGLEPPYERLGAYSLQLYLTGDWESAIHVSRQAVRTGREAGDTQGVLWNMPHLGMAAAASGRYDEAIAVFREARRFGEEYELLAGLPRCIAMSAGFHLDLFDFEGAEAIQQEARDLGRTYFNPSAVSAGIDLLFNFTRRGDLGRAQGIVDDVAEEVMKGGGWHGWLWRLRFTQLQAEMAAARGHHPEAMDLARQAIDQSKSKHRTKYEVFGRVTLGRALAAAGHKSAALRELSLATASAASLGNPALQVMVAASAMEVEPDEVVALEARGAVQRILATLSDATLRHRFLNSDAVRTIGSD
ncbi:MAG: AAA family ATPase [Actinobacteria bacterium]|nr:AAA family ATPase [Actinomycetota bacterium]